MIRSIITPPPPPTNTCAFAYSKHLARRRHLSCHVLNYISMLMVAMLMITAIYFKWVIISRRLHLGMALRALTNILPGGNRLAMMSCRSVPPLCILAPRSRLPTSSSLHLFVLCFNLRIACQEQSSVAIPPHNSAPRHTKR